MGANKAEQDARTENVGSRVQSIARAWDALDSAIRTHSENDGLTVRSVKFLTKGSGWLVIVSVELEGQGFVAFGDASSSGDLGKVVWSILERSEWKPDKFYKGGNGADAG